MLRTMTIVGNRREEEERRMEWCPDRMAFPDFLLSESDRATERLFLTLYIKMIEPTETTRGGNRYSSKLSAILSLSQPLSHTRGGESYSSKVSTILPVGGSEKAFGGGQKTLEGPDFKKVPQCLIKVIGFCFLTPYQLT